MSRLALLVALLLLASFVARQAPAAVEVGGVSYDHVDPGEPFAAATQPTEDWQPARATRAEGRAGLIAYWRPAPEDLRPWSRPRPEECIRKPLRTFAALGETEPVWVAIYARDDLSRITARVEDLPEGVTAELFVVHFWPQRTSWRTRQYYVTPELLLPYDASEGYAWLPGHGVLERKSYDLPAGSTGAIWLRLRVATSTVPGTYRFRLHLQAERHRRLTVPLELEVLPFELRKPEDRAWLMYADIGRWEKMSDQQRWIDAKDFAAHGMDGLVSMPLGTPDLSRLKEGVVKWDVSKTRRYLELLQQAGLRGPWVMSGNLVGRVRQALGLAGADLKKPWPSQLKEGVRTAARPLVDIYTKLGLDWYFYGWDEPSGDNLYALQQYQTWKEAGAPIYVTMCRQGFWEAMAQYLDAPCFSSSFVNNRVACEKTLDACRRLGKKFWWYGSGCYIGEEGRLFPNRYLAGILFWKTGADAQVSWTYMRPHEDPFNDFDGVKANRVEPKDQDTVYPWLEKAGDWSTYRGPIQTIQWEALREGVDDYCYLWTLKDLASRASAAPGPERSRAGRKAARSLRDISTALPWSPDLRRMGFGNQQCQSVRRLVADQIRELEAGTLGRPGSRLPEQLIHLRLKMQPASQGPAETLPVAAVPRLSQPPKIDGTIDEKAWQQGAQVSIDRDVRTGEAVKPAARAWLGYDDRALYVAFWCDEPRMDGLVAKTTGRDAEGIWEDDSVELFLDPTGQRQQYAHFIVNTAGAWFDELGEKAAWNSSALVKVGKFKSCWQCEMAIPWSDLAAAGLTRNSVMALNLCRNRYADSAAGWDHAAWSVTYSWYHVPERFGVALLEQGDVGLAAIELPTLFGKQMLKLALANHTGARQMVRLQASVKYEGEQTASPPEKLLVDTAPGELTLASIPVPLTRPGKAYVKLSFGPEGGRARTATFAVVVPEPAGVPVRLLTLRRDRRLEARVNLNVAPSSDTYVLEGTLVAAGRTQWRGTLDCSAGRAAYLEGRAEMPWVLAWLDLRLLRQGREIWQMRLPVMPQYEALGY